MAGTRIRPLPFATSLALAASLLGPAAAVSAEDEEAPIRPRFELPRAPHELDPVLGFEVHLTSVFPLARDPLCPADADCILGGGGGIGGSVERRWPFGVSVALGYDAWFLDSNGVYELGVMQAVTAHVRYFSLPEILIHPYVSVGIGALIFGDTLKVATVGVAFDVAAGVEIELTESIALVFALPFRLFTTESFVTRHDRVPRAEDGGGSATVAFQLGISVLETP